MKGRWRTVDRLQPRPSRRCRHGANRPFGMILLILPNGRWAPAAPLTDCFQRERNTAQGTLRSLVENEVQKLLPHGKANRQRVAKALSLSERTLAQKLGEENTSYENVVDRLRHSLAVQSITEPSVSVAQIAWLLGYEGPTSFNNAFARWTGRSASEARSDDQRSSDGKVSKLGCAP